MSENEFTKEDVFINSRVAFLNDELHYLKSTYFQNIVSYSFYNTVDALTNYSGDVNNLKKLNKNYSKLNDLVLEGMLSGSFEGNVQSSLENKTIIYFLDKYKESFDKNNNANLTFEVLDINVYEDKPYFLSLQILANLSVDTSDNISQWNSQEYFYVDVPVDNLIVPDFLYHENLKVRSKSAEYNLPDKNWSLKTFTDVINLSYSSVFVEEEHKYSIGKSYLKRLLNITDGSYKDVIASYNFDYDLSEGELYDTSLYNNFSLRYGNSLGIYNMDNMSLVGNVMPDASDYNHNLTIFNGVNCNATGIIGTSCLLDGQNDYMRVQNLKAIKNNVSIFAWVNISNSTAIDRYQRIVCAKDGYFCYLYDSVAKTFEVILNGTNQKSGGVNRVVFEGINVSLGKWNHIGFTYDGNLTLLYVNSIKYYSELPNLGSNNYYGDLNSSIGNLHIGTNQNFDSYFNGSIDEVGIYNKVLNKEEIGELFDQRRVIDADYVDALYGKGRYFDGKDDYINLGNNSVYDFTNSGVSMEFWFRLNNLSGKQVLVDKGINAVNGWGVMIDNGYVSLIDHGFKNPKTLDTVINKTNYFYHVVVTVFSGNLKIFINGKEYPTNYGAHNPAGPGVYFGSLTTYNLTIGKRSDANTDYFNGVIDEIKFYNRLLKDQEVENNYYNYASLAKGCCNYILLVNPNNLGYNNIAFQKNISYSTKLFYDYHKFGKSYNMSLYNLTNVTSSDTSKNFYNFLFDDCINHAFSASDYQLEDPNIKLDLYKLDGEDNASCSNLVKMGIY